MDNFFTTTEAAQHAGVSVATIRYWIKKGYLGNCAKQTVTSGRGCGYSIRQSDLDKHVHGWTIEEEARPVETEKTDTLVAVEDIRIDKRSLKTAANNLRIAIEFAQEELSKIEALL